MDHLVLLITILHKIWVLQGPATKKAPKKFIRYNRHSYHSFAVQKEIVNDFVIPTKNEDEKEKHRGRQFQIYFDIETGSYKIKDLGIGYGAFVKLNRPLTLRDNFLLNMGESYVVANLVKTSPEDDTAIKLRLKIFSVIKADQPDVL